MKSQETIGLQDLRVVCVIGCMPHEKLAVQEILFDIEVTPNYSDRPEDDKLDETVNYFALKDHAEKLAKKNSYHLIESLAHDLCDLLLSKMQIATVKVTIKKPTAIPGSAYAYVTVSKKR